MDANTFSIPKITFGRGRLGHAGICAQQLGASKIFVVSNPEVEKAGWHHHANRL